MLAQGRGAVKRADHASAPTNDGRTSALLRALSHKPRAGHLSAELRPGNLQREASSMRGIDMKRLLIRCGTVALVAGLTTAALALDGDTLMARWSFEDGGGDTAADTSGNGNDATLFGGPEFVAGHDGDGLLFTFATANYALAPVPYHNTATVLMWALYTGTPTGNIGLVHAQATEGDLGPPESKMIGIWVENSNKLWGRIIDPAGARVNLPKNHTLAPDVWFHTALVVDADAGTVTQWVDGEVVGEADYGGELGEYNFLKIGRQGTETWEGILDEVGFFSAALTEDDISTIMDDGFDAALAVSARGKAATTWGSVKRGVAR